jgi:gliding motility-associated-like protein
LVTDTNNCTATASATVNQPTQLQITATANSISCNGQADGSIATLTTGGTSPYTFTASNGANSYPSATGQYSALAAGTYGILVTDANSCTATASAAVTEPSALAVLPTTTHATCYSYTNGTIQLTASGGTPQYSYMFSTGTQNASGAEGGLAAGTYSYTVTDANQCSLVDSSIITEPDSVIISVSPTPITVELGDALPLTTTTNQTGNVAYYWQPAQGLSCYDCANPTFEGVYNQVYIVEATTDSGCVGTGQFTVTVTPDYRVFFPNIFTPNGDGVNDMWQFFTGSNAIKQLRVQVFNRTGEKVFEATDINAAWDGTYKGAYAPIGIYTYTANIVWLNNYNDNTYHGTITLIR